MIDWSCNDSIAVTDNDQLNIYDSNGELLSSYRVNLYSDLNKIIAVKWSGDGEYFERGTKRIAQITSNNLTPAGLRDMIIMLFL